MNKKNIIIIAFAILLFAILVWGLVGSSQAAKIGTTCNIGIGKDGSVFCWTWERNTLGEVGDAINDVFNN